MAAKSSGRQTTGTRAKDTDRTDTCQILDSALAEGQLSMTEHRQRVSTATNATTLGALAALVADLQNSNAPVKLPVLRTPGGIPGRGWGVRAAIAAVLVVLGIAIGWGLYGNTSSPLSFTPDPGAKADGVEPVVLTPPKAAAFAWRARRADGADAAALRRHRRLPVSGLPRLRVAGPTRSRRRSPSAQLHLPRRLG